MYSPNTSTLNTQLDTCDVLSAWRKDANHNTWAIAIIVETQGHSYRKRGAFTLVNQKGKQLGVLSGGCLEADIRLMAQKSLSLNKVLSKEYDGRDESDAAYQMGCGGIVWVKFIPLCDQNNHLHLMELLACLEQRQPAVYGLDHDYGDGNTCGFVNSDHRAQLTIDIQPKIHLLICGGGKDVMPVCTFAKALSWQVSVWDPRASYGNKEDLIGIDNILKEGSGSLTSFAAEQNVNFAVLMSHSVEIDTQALAVLAYSNIQHISLLGPKKRFTDVINRCGVAESEIKPTLSGPAGLELGGDLPSSIALSIIAQFHQLAFTEV